MAAAKQPPDRPKTPSGFVENARPMKGKPGAHKHPEPAPLSDPAPCQPRPHDLSVKKNGLPNRTISGLVGDARFGPRSRTKLSPAPVGTDWIWEEKEDFFERRSMCGPRMNRFERNSR